MKRTILINADNQIQHTISQVKIGSAVGKDISIMAEIFVKEICSSDDHIVKVNAAGWFCTNCDESCTDGTYYLAERECTRCSSLIIQYDSGEKCSSCNWRCDIEDGPNRIVSSSTHGEFLVNSIGERLL